MTLDSVVLMRFSLMTATHKLNIDYQGICKTYFHNFVATTQQYLKKQLIGGDHDINVRCKIDTRIILHKLLFQRDI